MSMHQQEIIDFKILKSQRIENGKLFRLLSYIVLHMHIIFCVENVSLIVQKKINELWLKDKTLNYSALVLGLSEICRTIQRCRKNAHDSLENPYCKQKCD